MDLQTISPRDIVKAKRFDKKEHNTTADEDRFKPAKEEYSLGDAQESEEHERSRSRILSFGDINDAPE